ncbi:LytTR family DNA-binding domain-containing protein [Brevundimonas sp. SORGH_AS_0993]|uniref:LytR/AlgR family response regulator transcription factor n=1 Tax=Brevundimonas sp. SORGH_AS_0993 TaxID=3041794 RepID=UPI0027D7E588|nr:LytTR family DNA-binding domain-containing protein [Brevundimonas sp. SORGH_AS_0993]
MSHAPVAAAVGLFAAYSYVATVFAVAWYLRRGMADLSVGASLLWAALSYMPWLGVAGLTWSVIRRVGAGWRAAGVLAAVMLLAVPLIAALNARTDMDFLKHASEGEEWAARTIDRLPVVLLLYTAVVAVGLAAAYWRSARDARDRIAVLTAALSEARTLEPEPTKRVLVSTGRTRASVSVGDIEWFASAGNYVVVNWDGKEGLIRDTLQSLEARLDPRLFTRSHRSSLINLARVAQVQPLSDGAWRLTMNSGAELVVSRTYRDAVLEKLGRTILNLRRA